MRRGMRCPVCGSEERFHVNGDADIFVDGRENVIEEIVCDEPYDSDCQGHCRACDHDDYVKVFRDTYDAEHPCEHVTVVGIEWSGTTLTIFDKDGRRFRLEDAGLWVVKL